MLVIHDAEKSDKGEYTIRVENSSGKDSATFQVSIVDRPDPPPEKPKITDITRTSVRLSWQPPQHDGGASITLYTIEKCELPGTHWLIAGSTQLSQMTVHRLRECKEYKFRILAENVHGTSDPSEETGVIVTQEPKMDLDYDKLGKI